MSMGNQTSSPPKESTKMAAVASSQRSKDTPRRVERKHARQHHGFSRQGSDKEKPLRIAQSDAAVEAQCIIDLMLTKLPTELNLAIVSLLSTMTYPQAGAWNDVKDIQRAAYNMLKFLPFMPACEGDSIPAGKTNWKILMSIASTAIVESCILAPAQHDHEFIGADTFQGERFPSAIYKLPQPRPRSELPLTPTISHLRPAPGLAVYGWSIRHLQLSIKLKQCRPASPPDLNDLQDRFQDALAWHPGLRSLRLELVIPRITIKFHKNGCDFIEKQIERIVEELRTLDLEYKAVKPALIGAPPYAQLEYLNMQEDPPWEIRRWAMVCSSSEIRV